MTRQLYDEWLNFINDRIVDRELSVNEFESLANEVLAKQNQSDSPSKDNDSKFFNKLFCEILPLKILVKNLCSKVIKVYPHSHRFDAILDSKHNIEVTCAIVGEERRKVIDTIVTDKIHISDVYSNAERYFKAKTLFQSRINNKYNNSKAEDKEAYLVVCFFIQDLFLDNSDKDELIKIIDSLNTNDQKFSKHYFIGWHHDENKEFFYQKK